jgi:hypothetical protein
VPNISFWVGAILHAGFGLLHCGSPSWLEAEQRKHAGDKEQE